MQLSITTNFPQLKRHLLDLREDISSKAAASAVNKVLAQAQTKMVQAIAQEFNVTQAYVRPRLRIYKASGKDGLGNVAGLLSGRGQRGKRSANIIAFVTDKATSKERKERRVAGTSKQLFVKVKRAGPKLSLGPKAFIGNKGRTVFERVGKERLPIKAISTIDVPSMFNTRRIQKVVTDLMLEKFPGIYANDVRFFVDRFNRSQ